MRKEEFLKQLEYLLQDIPDTDREEAINYYWDYLEEAGPENEESVLKEFGSPERIAAIIRSDHEGNLEDGGSFTEKGYEDERFRDPNYQLANRLDLPDEWAGAEEQYRRNQNENWNRKTGHEQRDSEYEYSEEKPARRTSGCLKVTLAVILVLAAFPLVLGIGGTTLGILTTVFVTGAVLFFVAGILTLVLLFVGVVLVGAGIAALFQEPVEGLLAIGFGLLIFGIGLLALLFSVWFYGKAIPWIFRGIGRCIDAVSDRLVRRR